MSSSKRQRITQNTDDAYLSNEDTWYDSNSSGSGNVDSDSRDDSSSSDISDMELIAEEEEEEEEEELSLSDESPEEEDEYEEEEEDEDVLIEIGYRRIFLRDRFRGTFSYVIKSHLPLSTLFLTHAETIGLDDYQDIMIVLNGKEMLMEHLGSSSARSLFVEHGDVIEVDRWISCCNRCWKHCPLLKFGSKKNMITTLHVSTHKSREDDLIPSKTGQEVAGILYEQIRLEMNTETKIMSSIFKKNESLFNLMHEKVFCWYPKNDADNRQTFPFHSHMVKMRKSECGIFIEDFTLAQPMRIKIRNLCSGRLILANQVVLQWTLYNVLYNFFHRIGSATLIFKDARGKIIEMEGVFTEDFLDGRSSCVNLYWVRDELMRQDEQRLDATSNAIAKTSQLSFIVEKILITNRYYGEFILRHHMICNQYWALTASLREPTPYGGKIDEEDFDTENQFRLSMMKALGIFNHSMDEIRHNQLEREKNHHLVHIHSYVNNILIVPTLGPTQCIHLTDGEYSSESTFLTDFDNPIPAWVVCPRDPIEIFDIIHAEVLLAGIQLERQLLTTELVSVLNGRVVVDVFISVGLTIRGYVYDSDFDQQAEISDYLEKKCFRLLQVCVKYESIKSTIDTLQLNKDHNITENGCLNYIGSILQDTHSDLRN